MLSMEYYYFRGVAVRNILIKNGILLIFAFLIVSVNLASVQARVIVHEKEKYYSVRGKTGAQIYKSISKNGPKVSKKHVVAFTSTRFKLDNFKEKITRRYCKIAKIDVVVALVYTYPKWHGYKRGSAKSRNNWDKFIKLLERHEKRHGKISVEIARKIERLVKRAKGQTSRGCEGFKTTVIRGLKLLRVKHQKLNAQFDRREDFKYSKITRSMIALIEGK